MPLSYALKVFAAPLLALILGVITLLANPPKRGEKWHKLILMWSILLMLIATSAVTAYLNYDDTQDAKQKSNELRNNLFELQDRNRRMEDEVAANVKQVQVIVERILRQGYALPSLRGRKDDEISNIFEADKKWQEMVLARQNNNNRQGSGDESIQYFVKDVDDPAYLVTLKEANLIGLNVEFRKSKHPEVPTNSIWASESVPADDVRLLALTMIKNGIRLKYVGSFCPKSDQRNQRLIQIGAEKEYRGYDDVKTAKVMQPDWLMRPTDKACRQEEKEKAREEREKARQEREKARERRVRG